MFGICMLAFKVESALIYPKPMEGPSAHLQSADSYCPF